MTVQTPVRGRAAPSQAPPTIPTHVTDKDRREALKAVDKLEKVGRFITGSLMSLGGGALVFTCVNVTLFAMTHDIPWYVAWLLDPLASLALITTLYVDGILADQGGYKASGWPLILRWMAGLSTWIMNCWTSLYPTGKVSLIPEHADPGGILLHSVAPALLIALAEASSGYRKHLAEQLAHHRAIVAKYQEQQHEEQKRKEREAREERERAEREAREERERALREAREEREREAQREAEREAEARREREAKREREAREHEARLKEAEREKEAERQRQLVLAQGEAEARKLREQAAEREKERKRQEAREAAERRRNQAASHSAPHPASHSAVAASQSGRRVASISAPAPSQNGSQSASESEGRVPREVRRQQKDAAEKWVAERLAEGREPTAKEVGAHFGKAETWGGDRLRAVKRRQHTNENEAGTAAAAAAS